MSSKTAPYYPPTETEAYAVVVPQESYQAQPPPSSTNSSRQYSTATASYATAPPPPVNTVTDGTTTPSVVNARHYVPIDSRKPVVLTYCPKCSKGNVQTRTHTKSNGTTALCVVAGVIIFWPLCWLPLCIQNMKQTNHYCSSCGTKVGRVKPFQ